MSSNAERTGLIEIGVIVAGPLDDVDRRSGKIAIDQTTSFLTATFPGFCFKLLPASRPELSQEGRVEPSLLMQQAVEDRISRHWDFVFVLTGSELVGNYSSYCFAALSRPLDAAVFSLSLIDPRAMEPEAEDSVRIERIAKRLSRLMLHALGHLAGLPVSEDSDNLLYQPASAGDLDSMQVLNEDQLAKQRTALAEIADQRLEETPEGRSNPLIFGIRATWINRREIIEAIWAARPWEFPFRLSRLTVASVSTVTILFMTAEAWDLALSQTAKRVGVLIILSLVATTIYVTVRQQLLIRRERQRSEQTVVTAVSALGIVFTGMLVTWSGLAVLGVMMEALLFRPTLIASWAASSRLAATNLDSSTMLQMSCFSASLGLLIGALGASFESQHYFRHVIFVDKEI